MKNPVKTIFLLLILILLSALQSLAVEEVTVEGSAVPEPVAAHPTASVSVIDTSESAEVVSDVGEALERSAGLTIRRYGGLGDFSVVMLRGAGPNQVGIYLDGIPLTGASQGVVNLADLPLDPLGRIEVYRGVAPLNMGSSIGGAVNLVTRQAPGGWTAGASQSYGSFSTHKSDLFTSGTFGPIGGLVFYSHLQSEGDFEYEDDNGTPFNKSDDETVRRKNNQFSSDDVLLKVSYKPWDKWEFFVGNEFFNKNEGVPGIGAVQSEEADLRTLRNSLHTGGQYLGDAYEIRAMAYYVFIREEFDDPLGEIGVGTQDNRLTTLNYGANGLVKLIIGSRGTVSLFSEVREERFRDRDLRNGISDDDKRRTSVAGAVQGEAYLWGEKVVIVPAARLEYYANRFPGRAPPTGFLPAEGSSREESLFSPRLGIRVTPLEHLTFHANAGRYFRLPTFFELFGDRGNVAGNPDLDVESGVHADAGAALTFEKVGYLDKLSISYTYYYLGMEDLIALIQNSQRVSRAENIGKAEIAGHEAMAELQAFDHVRMNAAYTFQETADRSDIPYARGNPLPGRPRNELHLNMSLFRDPYGEIFYTLDYLDGNFLDRRGLLVVPARTIHGAGISITPVRNQDLTLTFEAKNIGDERVFDVLGFPLPGRSFFGTLSYKYSREPARNLRDGQ